MGRPRSNLALTLDGIVASMKPGHICTCSVIAKRFGVPGAVMRLYLDKLVARGDLEPKRSSPKTVGFRIPQIDAPVERPVIAEPWRSIATPPVLVRLTGTLTGYDRDIARLRELCMMVRGMR